MQRLLLRIPKGPAHATPLTFDAAGARKRGLTAKEILFVSEYLRDQDQGLAAIRAGYSAHTAISFGSQLAKRPYIRAEIDRALDERLKRNRIDADADYRTLRDRLMRIVQADIRSFMAWEETGRPTIHPSALLTDDAAAAIQKVSMRGGVLHFEFHDPIRAAELVAKLDGRMPSNKVTISKDGISADGAEGGIHIYLPDNGRQAALPPSNQVPPLVLDLPMPEPDDEAAAESLATETEVEEEVTR